jgi:cysteine desulfurase
LEGNPAFASGTGMIAAMLVNNEIGVIQPVAALADAAHAAGAKPKKSDISTQQRV